MRHNLKLRSRLYLSSCVVFLTISVVLLTLTISGDIAESRSSPVLGQDGFGLYGFSITATVLCTVVPLLLVLKLFRSSNRFQTGKHNCASRPIRWLRRFGILVAASGVVTAFYVLERVIPFSVVPFATATSAVLFACASYYYTRALHLEFRLAAVAIGVMLILGMTFLDWNDRKPFLRDLYSVRPGMTIDELKQRMGTYLNRTSQEDENPEVKENYEIVYRPSNEAAYNADLGIVVIRNGKVYAAGYSAD